MNRRVTALQAITTVILALALVGLALSIGVAASALTPVGTLVAAAALVANWVGLAFWLFPPECR